MDRRGFLGTSISAGIGAVFGGSMSAAQKENAPLPLRQKLVKIRDGILAGGILGGGLFLGATSQRKPDTSTMNEHRERRMYEEERRYSDDRNNPPER